MGVEGTEGLDQGVDVERGAGFVVDVEAVEDDGAEGAEGLGCSVAGRAVAGRAAEEQIEECLS